MGFDTSIEDDMKHIVRKFNFFCRRNREEERKKTRKNEKLIVDYLIESTWNHNDRVWFLFEFHTHFTIHISLSRANGRWSGPVIDLLAICLVIQI